MQKAKKIFLTCALLLLPLPSYASTNSITITQNQWTELQELEGKQQAQLAVLNQKLNQLQVLSTEQKTRLQALDNQLSSSQTSLQDANQLLQNAETQVQKLNQSLKQSQMQIKKEKQKQNRLYILSGLLAGLLILK